MLDTEYYVTHDDHNNLTHFRDICTTMHDQDRGCSGDGHHIDGKDDFMVSDGLAEKLAERSPLVVVPIPFISDWFMEHLNTKKKKSLDITTSSVDAEADVSFMDSDDSRVDNDDVNKNRKKRNRDMEISSSAEPNSKQRLGVAADDSEEMVCDDGPSSSKTEISPEGPPIDGTASDWWPQGFMRSSKDELPILAKLYYDQMFVDGTSTRKLRLNDIVEMIGVVSVNPMQADFSNQQEKAPTRHIKNDDSNSGPHGDVARDKNSSGDMFFDDEQFFADEEERLVLPPPSQLPRLHVLCYNVLDLDQMSAALTRPATNTRQEHQADLEEQPSIMMSEPIDYRLQALNLLSSEPILNNNKVVSEAIMLALLSMAQRKQSPLQTDYNGSSELSSWDCVSTPTEDSTLGCASLNIQIPSEPACRQFYDDFKSLLDDLCPVVASIDLTLHSLNNDGASGSNDNKTIDYLRAPAKNAQGRLTPNIFQLPKGSAILIHMGNMSEGTIDSTGLETLEALRSLVLRHSVPYSFGTSLMKYPFEADYRVFVVSTRTNNNASMEQDENIMRPNNSNNSLSRCKLLPCALQVVFDGLSGGDTSTKKCLLDEHYASQFKMLREFFISCRSVDVEHFDAGLPGGSNNVSLTNSVLKLAQKDFIQRRTMARKAGQDESAMVREEDFHRWLTLTRLEARSRNGSSPKTSGKRGYRICGVEATAQDWERALAIDDAMKGVA